MTAADRVVRRHAMPADALPAGASGRPIRTAAIANLGCKVNQAEMEGAARRLRERGIAIVDGDRPADLVLVNTCTVTAEADAKSRNAVRRARRASPDAPIVVTGCAVQVGREAFRDADPTARLVDNRAKDALLAEIERLVGPAGAPSAGRVGAGAGPLTGAGPLAGALPTLSGVAIEGIEDAGYRVVTNVGRWGGQTVDHLHFHLMGGRPFDWPPG